MYLKIYIIIWETSRLPTKLSLKKYFGPLLHIKSNLIPLILNIFSFWSS
jgi:hypothetical protein